MISGRIHHNGKSQVLFIFNFPFIFVGEDKCEGNLKNMVQDDEENTHTQQHPTKNTSSSLRSYFTPTETNTFSGPYEDGQCMALGDRLRQAVALVAGSAEPESSRGFTLCCM